MITLAFTVALAALSPEQLLNQVQKAYLQAGDIEARFSQTFVEKLRGKKRVEKGRLWAKQDGRVRWRYDEPVRKDFVFDGKKAYFYEPADAQVTIFDDFSESELSNALKFLMGRGQLAKRFDIESCKKHCDLGEPGNEVIALYPKQPLANVDHVLLYVDPKSVRVSMSVVFDSLGNRTEYRFNNVEFHADVPEKRFAFEVPEGVQQVRVGKDGLN